MRDYVKVRGELAEPADGALTTLGNILARSSLTEDAIRMIFDSYHLGVDFQASNIKLPPTESTIYQVCSLYTNAVPSIFEIRPGSACDLIRDFMNSEIAVEATEIGHTGISQQNLRAALVWLTVHHVPHSVEFGEDGINLTIETYAGKRNVALSADEDGNLDSESAENLASAITLATNRGAALSELLRDYLDFSSVIEHVCGIDLSERCATDEEVGEAAIVFVRTLILQPILLDFIKFSISFRSSFEQIIRQGGTPIGAFGNALMHGRNLEYLGSAVGGTAGMLSATLAVQSLAGASLVSIIGGGGLAASKIVQGDFTGRDLKEAAKGAAAIAVVGGMAAAAAATGGALAAAAKRWWHSSELDHYSKLKELIQNGYKQLGHTVRERLQANSTFLADFESIIYGPYLRDLRMRLSAAQQERIRSFPFDGQSLNDLFPTPYQILTEVVCERLERAYMIVRSERQQIVERYEAVKKLDDFDFGIFLHQWSNLLSDLVPELSEVELTGFKANLAEFKKLTEFLRLRNLL